MADESYEWLDLETAERLLRGESLEAVDEADRDRAERLARTLDALTVEPAPTSGGLPGEEAALAAFRKVRADREDRAQDSVGPSDRGRHRAGTGSADAGLVRIGVPDAGARRARRRRPAHLGLAAVLAVGMAGGVAAAAGIGVLPHFGNGEPEPAATVSAASTPDRPLGSPPASAPEVAPSPEGTPSGGSGSRDTARGGTGATPGKGSEGLGGRSRGDWNGAASACRDVRAGKKLDPSRKHSLEGAAGGASQVWKYCQGVLSGTGSQGGDAQSAPDGHKGDAKSDGKGEGKGEHGDHDKDGHGAGHGRGNGNGGNGNQFTSPRKNHHGPDGGTASGAPIAPPGATMSPDPAPSPSYSAL
ncbi:hypothetical protein [Streptomyces sp. NRRL B-24085]|uniref:hypothetical protein n=1 Tax=Streptomyces sp. NRRL B-24085 TaxID=1709476 RepID=UPI0006B311B4|nr:hypothetical protein [Streptomyces sp. NRRL B-24085]